jgi:tripartite-type tricarboxylate transporter receptor subunit TctC
MHLIRCVAFALAALPGACLAAYPERPITMIVAFVPGGGTDVVARALVPYLEKQLGANARIVVVNRGGAGGEIGFTAIANAPPDGYTIGFINSPATQAIPTSSTIRRALPCMPTRSSRTSPRSSPMRRRIPGWPPPGHPGSRPPATS